MVPVRQLATSAATAAESLDWVGQHGNFDVVPDRSLADAELAGRMSGGVCLAHKECSMWPAAALPVSVPFRPSFGFRPKVNAARLKSFSG